MKVLYVINEVIIGGAALSLFDFLENAEECISPLVIVPGEGSVKEIFSNAGYKCVVVPFGNDICRLSENSSHKCDLIFMNNIDAARVIAKIAIDEDVDIIHSNSSTSNVGIMAAVFAGVPHIWHIREFAEEDFDIEYIDKQLKMRLLKSSNELISISDCLTASLLEKYDISSVRIYNGIVTRIDLENNSDESKDDSFLFVGSISQNKGQIYAVKAVELLVHDGLPNVKLYIIGSGKARDCWIIKKYIDQHNLSDNIELISFTRDLDSYRNRCGYAIIGSKMEALGRVTVEAMAAGNIPIGTDSGGTKELIGEDGQRGFLYKYGDYHQLAAKMREAMSMDSNTRERIIDDMRKFAFETFDVTEYGKKILSIYKSVLENDTCKNKRAELKEYLENRYNNLCQKPILGSVVSVDYKNARGRIKENIDNLGQFLSNHGFRRIVIYGMGDIGCAFYDYLSANNYEIIGVMDEDADILKEVVNVIEVGGSIERADCVLVTPLKDQNKVVRKLNLLYSNKCRVVGIEEIFGSVVQPHEFS